MRQDVYMPDEPQLRSVKISEDERRGWSSERPRRDGDPARPPDISVRCRVLTPSDHLRYSPGSMLVIASPSAAERDRFTESMIPNKASVLSLDKVRALLAGRVPEEEVATRAPEILAAAILKRLQAGETVVVAADGLGAEEREGYARMAASARRPRHLILLEAGREEVADDDRRALNELRRRLDAGELGAEGFQTAVRIGGASLGELKRILFQHPPRED
jgi:predicted kinase